MAGRSWRWLRARILGLLATPPAGWRDVPVENRPGYTRSEPIWATRVQSALFTPRQG